MNVTATMLAYATVLNSLRKLGFNSQPRIDALKAIVQELKDYIKAEYIPESKRKYSPVWKFFSPADFYDTLSLECSRFQSLCQALFDANFEGLDVNNSRCIYYNAVRVIIIMEMVIEDWEITLDASRRQPISNDDISIAE